MKPGPELERVRGAEWQSWAAARRARFVKAAVRYWRERGFPYYDLTPEQIRRELCALAGSDPGGLFAGGSILSSNVGLRLANYFHPQMWRVRCTRYLSPLETFGKEARLERAIRKALTIWPDRCGAGASCLRRMLKSFSNTVGVSNFRPTAARAIIHRYSPEGGRVLDFSAGYGGRLLGALTLSRDYLGIDPSRDQVRGLRQAIRTCGPFLDYRREARILCARAEKAMPALHGGEFDLVFSSPPYFDREKYGAEPAQSFRQYPTWELWLEGFLAPVLRESARALRRGGRLVINVADGPQPLAQCVRELVPPTLEWETEWRLKLAKLPYKRSGAGDAFKSEPVLVFRKRGR